MDERNKSTDDLGPNEVTKGIEFEEIYDQYYQTILNYHYRLAMDIQTAEELTSNTFYKAMKAYDRYKEIGKCKSWLYTIATNEFKIHYRTLKKDIYLPKIDDQDGRVFFGQEIEENIIDDKIDKFNEIHNKLKKLPAIYQTVIMLRYFEDQSYEEVAKILGKKLNTVKSILCRAHKHLKSELVGKI